MQTPTRQLAVADWVFYKMALTGSNGKAALSACVALTPTSPPFSALIRQT